MAVDVKAGDGISRNLVLELDALTVTFPEALSVGVVGLRSGTGDGAKKCCTEENDAEDNISHGISRLFI